MDKYELLLRDIHDILLTIGDVAKVSHGAALSLDQEDTFTAIYIRPELDTFEPHKLGTSANSYTNTFYVRLDVNMDCSSNDLYWVEVRRLIIDVMLEDSAIWSNILDRDIINIAQDDYQNYPRKTMSLIFEFKIREDCIV